MSKEFVKLAELFDDKMFIIAPIAMCVSKGMTITALGLENAWEQTICTVFTFFWR
jgi:hypothetical protein